MQSLVQEDKEEDTTIGRKKTAITKQLPFAGQYYQYLIIWAIASPHFSDLVTCNLFFFFFKSLFQGGPSHIYLFNFYKKNLFISLSLSLFLSLSLHYKREKKKKLMAKLSQQKNISANNNNSTTSGTSVPKVKRTRRSVPRDSPPRRSSIYRGVTR